MNDAATTVPLVTIIITTYNYAHLVGGAIESALAQEYPNLEVLVLDNASADETPAVVARYAADPRLRYVRHAENIGMVPNHNFGLREMRGDFVLFLSADDTLMPGHVSRSERYLRDHPEVDVLYTTTYFMNEAGKMIGIRQMGGQPYLEYAGGRNEFAALLTEGCYICFPTMLMPRWLFDRYGLLDEEMLAGDYEIVVRWAANGVRFGYVPEPMVDVRIHDAQQSSNKNYSATARDVNDLLHMVMKFAEPHAEQLRDYELAISRHLWGRYHMGLTNGLTDPDQRIRGAIDRADALLGVVLRKNQQQPASVALSVIVLASTHAADTERTLRSIAAQTHDSWNALVMEQTGFSVESLCARCDPRGRITRHRFITAVGDTVAATTAMKLATGNAFIVVRSGNEFAPTHFASVVEALSVHEVDALRTPAQLYVDGNPVAGAFIPLNEMRLAQIAPFGPVESLVYRRSAIDKAFGLNLQLGSFAEWELYLRLLRHARVGAIGHAAPVAIHTRSGTYDSYNAFATLPAMAEAIYASHPSPEAALTAERSAYLRNVQRHLQLGPAENATAAGIAALYRAATGLELLETAR